jgi:hypothetical protein
VRPICWRNINAADRQRPPTQGHSDETPLKIESILKRHCNAAFFLAAPAGPEYSRITHPAVNFEQHQFAFAAVALKRAQKMTFDQIGLFT